MIRPQPARWFEILAARDDAALALEALARTGVVELEAAPSCSLPATLADLRPVLAQFAELALRYRAYWPATCLKPSGFPEAPARALDRALAQVREWAGSAEPVIRRLQRGKAERTALRRWRRVCLVLGQSPIDLAGVAGAGPSLVRARLFVLPAGSEPAIPPRLLLRQFVDDGEIYALAVGLAEELALLEQHARASKGHVHDVPAWFEADMPRNLARLDARLRALAAEDARLRARLDALQTRHALPEALGNLCRLHWVLENVHALESGELFCRITGWTSEPGAARLVRALDGARVRALLHFPPPPEGARAPLTLANPAWARPFEVFSRALGMPSRNEADPSALLALTVPLMFGYMFGDVGQGLVIAGAGVLLRKRYPLAGLFVAGGLAAAVFGVLFGSMFGMHVLPPLWLAPLDAPLTILLVPLAGGAVLLTIGLVLRALAAGWRGDFVAWLATDAALLAVYLGILAGTLWPPGFAFAAAAALAHCLGRAWRARRPLTAFAAVAELVESTAQILINTLSFARIGAFALAHAGLSSALLALMSGVDSAILAGTILVAGNIVVIVLEGLVVSIQTTRLVLFEFFTRFLSAEGRVFRPLPPPPSMLQESHL